eukprot:scaffold2134_cov93-Cylindrotheca_fusiformis.AAC.10
MPFGHTLQEMKFCPKTIPSLRPNNEISNTSWDSHGVRVLVRAKSRPYNGKASEGENWPRRHKIVFKDEIIVAVGVGG